MSDERKLTAGERLLVQRLRLGETQTQAARRHGCKRTKYSLMELDRTGGPSVKIGAVKPHELCVIYRRRANRTQRRVAWDLGYSRYWVHRMEKGLEKCDDLLWYWEQ